MPPMNIGADSGLNYRSNVNTVLITTRAANTPTTLPNEGNFVVVLSSTGNVSFSVPGDASQVEAPVGKVIRFDKAFASQTIGVQSDSPNDTIKLDIGYGFEIPLNVLGVILTGLSVKGQYAFNTAVTETNVYPFIGGMIYRIPGGNTVVRDMTTMDGDALSIGEPRQELIAGSALAPGASSAKSLLFSKEMVTLQVTFNSPATDKMTVLVGIDGSGGTFAPIIYNAATGLPTATRGQVDTANGEYFFMTEGNDTVTFTANGANAGNLTLFAAASRACRPALMPIVNERTKRTYSVCGTPISSLNVELFSINAGSKKVHIKWIKVMPQDVGSAGQIVYTLQRNSTLNTNGQALTPVKHNTASVAATTTFAQSVVGAGNQITSGTAVGPLRIEAQSRPTTAIETVPMIFKPEQPEDEAFILQAGSTESFLVKVDAVQSVTYNVSCEFTEED